MGNKSSNQSNNFQNNQTDSIDSKGQSFNSEDYNQQIQSVSSHTGLKLLHTKSEDKNKKTVAVIVSFCSGCTYDNLFTTVQQKAQQGTKVLVYQAQSSYVKNLLNAFEGQPKNDIQISLINQIKSVDPDCVVFNWECSSNYSTSTFTEGKKDLFKFVQKMIGRGHMCMFSDFSLKALIAQWNQSVLGPNPFEKVSETSQTIQLRFKAGELKECPSAQLQSVGQLAEQGKINCHAMGGTIVYSVHKNKCITDKYKLQVLTVAANIKAPSDKLVCKIGEFQGCAGHVLLTYPSGGQILTSMGHWIQLMKIDTSQKKIFEVAARQYGNEYAQLKKKEYFNLSQGQKVSWRGKQAAQFVQNQAPCKNMQKKSRF